MKRTQILMNNSVYICLSIPEMGKMVMHKFLYDYVKLKYGEKGKIMLHGYRKIYSLHKNRRHFRRHCKKC